MKTACFISSDVSTRHYTKALALLAEGTRREYWNTYLPLTLAIVDFLYDTSRESIPFFVGNQILPKIKPGDIEHQYVEFRNTRIAGPVPYRGGDVGLFVGLVRVQASDLAERFFQFLETIVKAFDITSISRYLDIAKPLSVGLSDLLGMNGSKLRFGFRDEFADREGDPHQFRQGYLVYVNCADSDVSRDDLWVKEDRLFLGKNKDMVKPVTEYDYCLVKLECLKQRSDYTVLPFFQLWREARQLLLNEERQKAEWKKTELFQHLAASPDLTEEHREALIQVFAANFFAMTTPPGSVTQVRGSANYVSSIQTAAQAAEKAGFPKTIVGRIIALRDRCRDISENQQSPADSWMDAELINRQIASFKRKKSWSGKPDPKKLADALTLGVMRPI